jgi:hypothetical protein
MAEEAPTPAGGAGERPEEGEGTLGFLKWLIDLLRGQHPVIAYGVILALVVVFAAVAARQTGIVEDGLEETAIFIGKVVAAGIFVIAVAAFLKRFPIIGNLTFGLLFLFVLIYTSCFFTQVITNNRFAAMPRAPCFYLLTAQGCPLSGAYTGADVRSVAAQPVDPLVAFNPSLHVDPASTPLDRPEGPAVDATDEPAPARHAGAVYVHFAGAIDRADVRAATNRLAQLGWQVQDRERGGERIGTAAGLNEVRYFHEEDKAAAEALARAYGTLAPWVDGQSLKIRDLSRSGAKARPGLLEVWTSRP